MARLRFPGRPGHRFGRLGVLYGTDELKNDADPISRLISNIHQGLRAFRELFGDSDEEDFPGFTDKEVACIEKKLNKLTSDLEYLESVKTDGASIRLVGCRHHPAKAEILLSSLVSTGQVKTMGEESSSRLREGRRQSIQKEIRSSANHKPLSSIKIRLTGDKGKIIKSPVATKKKPYKPQSLGTMKVKIGPQFLKPVSKSKDPTPTVQVDSESDEDIKYSLPKKSSKHLIESKKRVEKSSISKKLLNKVKKSHDRKKIKLNNDLIRKKVKAGQLTKSGKDRNNSHQTKHNVNKLVSPKSMTSSPSPGGHQKGSWPRKQFVIPVKSSRSSRQIKPNKRFLDDASTFSSVVFSSEKTQNLAVEAVTHQTKPLVPPTSEQPEQGLESNLLQCSRLVSPASQQLDLHKSALLESPLIVEGKRERKPSMRLLRKLTDENEVKQFADDHKPEKHDRSKSLSSKSLLHSKFSGKSILHKAKLRLNQAAVNRSKAALVKTLRAEMRREEKVSDKQELESQESGDVASSLEKDKITNQAVRFLPLEGSRFKPRSPIKFSSISREPPVFGLSSLPAVPKFAMESTTASLPTFQSAQQQSMAPVTQASRTCTSTLQVTSEQEASVQTPPPQDSTSCIICQHPRPRIRSHTKTQTQVCDSCKRFYKRKSVKMVMTGKPFICENYGECSVLYRDIHKGCVACRYLRCCKKLASANTIPSVGRVLLQKGLSKMPSRKVIVRKRKQHNKSAKKKCQDEQKMSSLPASELHTGVLSTTSDVCHGKIANQTIEITQSNEQSASSPVQAKIGPETKMNTEEQTGPATTTKISIMQMDVDHTSTPATDSATIKSTAIESPPMQKAVEKSNNSPIRKIRLDDNTCLSPVVCDTDQSSHLNILHDTSPETCRQAELITNPTVPSAESGEEGVCRTRSAEDRLHGPRVKYVCRRSKVALGEPATFPTPQELTLSALPYIEKERILSMERTRAGSPDSDDMSMDEIIRQARDDSQEVVTLKRTPNKVFKPLLPRRSSDNSSTSHGPIKIYKRAMRCKNCAGCRMPHCGVCVNCRDMIKFGGNGTMKKACKDRVCLNPFKKGQSNRAALNVTSKCRTESRDPAMKEENKKKAGWVTMYDHEPGSGMPTRHGESVSSVTQRRSVPLIHHDTSHQLQKAHHSQHDTSHQLHKGRLITKLPQQQKRERRILKAMSPDGNLPSRRRKWPSFSQENHLINATYKEDFDIDESWRRGVALVSSVPICLRVVCYLCASVGQEQMVFCSVCCEPFHQFCLEEKERPSEDNIENWVCRRCQACTVCGKTSNLLTCQKCEDKFHPECLGPNYPTKPTRKGTWLCAKCVKCKSCGRTTPGTSKEATWTHDFSLCFDCGRDMDKGNFCPVCHKTYADQDYDTPMVLCCLCKSWVHSECENISAEYYEMLNILPEEVEFHCSVCLGNEPAPWRQTVEVELMTGLNIVMDAIVSKKSHTLLEPIHNQEEHLPVSQQSTKCDILGAAIGPRTSLGTEKTTEENNEDNNIHIDGTTVPLLYPSEQSHSNSKLVENITSLPQNIDKAADITAEPSHETCEPSHRTATTCCQSTDRGRQLRRPSAKLNDSDSSRTISVVSPGHLDPSDVSVIPVRSLEGATSQGLLSDEVSMETTPSIAQMSAANDVFLEIMNKKNGQSSEVINACSPSSTNKPADKKSFPSDFRTIRKKIKARGYKTVNEFVDDVVRILQFNLTHQHKAAQKKATDAIRSVFIKMMTECFPWCKVEFSELWLFNQKLPQGMLPNATLPPFDDHTYAQWMEREKDKLLSPQPSPFKKLQLPRCKPPADDDSSSIAPSEFEPIGDDPRKCSFCHKVADQRPNDAGRMLYVGQDAWVHVNCALWSAEVYEEVDGTLQNVLGALMRGKKMRCDTCSGFGATVGCCETGCSANYHMMCARQQLCSFQEDKKVYCRLHMSCIDGEVVPEDKFAVLRRACVEPEQGRQIKKLWHRGVDHRHINITIGSLTMENIGVLTTLSDMRNLLIPVNYTISRVFWSTVDARRRCVYTCKVVEVRPRDRSSADIVMKDMTIIHDRGHPQYDEQVEVDFMASVLSVDTHTQDTEDLDNSVFYTDSGEKILLSPDNDSVPIRSRISGSGEDLTASTGSSWHQTVRKIATSHHLQPRVKLTGLSPSTLKLLNKAGVSESTAVKSFPAALDEDGQLTEIVDRLNSAAARSRSKSRSSRESSMEGSRHSREGSVDSVSAPCEKHLLTLDRLPEEEVNFSLTHVEPGLHGTQTRGDDVSGIKTIVGEGAPTMTQSTDQSRHAICQLDGPADDRPKKYAGTRTTRQSSGEEGSFRCPKCKRFYRTKDSCTRHTQVCTFEVSSDEEDEESSGEDLSSSVKDYPLRRPRMSDTSSPRSHKSTRSEQQADSSDAHSDNAGQSGRGSTQKAHNSSPATRRGRGRPKTIRSPVITCKPNMNPYVSLTPCTATSVIIKAADSMALPAKQIMLPNVATSVRKSTPSKPIVLPQQLQSTSVQDSNSPSSVHRSGNETNATPVVTAESTAPVTTSITTVLSSQHLSTHTPVTDQIMSTRKQMPVVSQVTLDSMKEKQQVTPVSEPLPTTLESKTMPCLSAGTVESKSLIESGRSDNSLNYKPSTIIRVTGASCSEVQSGMINKSSSSQVPGRPDGAGGTTTVTNNPPRSKVAKSTKVTVSVDRCGNIVSSNQDLPLTEEMKESVKQLVQKRFAQLPKDSKLPTPSSAVTGANKSQTPVRRQVKVVTVSPMNIEKLKGDQLSVKTATTFANILPKSSSSTSPNNETKHHFSGQERLISPTKPIFGSRLTSTHGPVAQAVVQPIVQRSSGIMANQNIESSNNYVHLQQQQTTLTALHSQPAYNLTPIVHSPHNISQVIGRSTFIPANQQTGGLITTSQQPAAGQATQVQQILSATGSPLNYLSSVGLVGTENTSLTNSTVTGLYNPQPGLVQHLSQLSPGMVLTNTPNTVIQSTNGGILVAQTGTPTSLPAHLTSPVIQQPSGILHQQPSGILHQQPSGILHQQPSGIIHHSSGIIHQQTDISRVLSGQSLLSQSPLQQQIVVSDAQATLNTSMGTPLVSISSPGLIQSNFIQTMTPEGSVIHTDNSSLIHNNLTQTVIQPGMRQVRTNPLVSPGSMGGSAPTIILASSAAASLASGGQYTAIYSQSYLPTGQSSSSAVSPATSVQPKYSQCLLPKVTPTSVAVKQSPPKSESIIETLFTQDKSKIHIVPKDATRIKAHSATETISSKTDSTVADILKSLKQQMSKNIPTKTSPVTDISDNTHSTSTNTSKMDIQAFCEEITKKSASLAREGKNVKIHGEVDDRGVTRFTITAVKKPEPTLPTQTKYVMNLDQSVAVPSKRYEQGMIGGADKTKPIPSTVEQMSLRLPVQQTKQQISVPVQDRVPNQALIKKALMVKKGLLHKRKREDISHHLHKPKKFRSYHQLNNELRAKSEGPSERKALPYASLLRPTVLRTVQTGKVPPLSALRQNKQPAHMDRLPRQGRKDMPEVMRPHPIVHPKRHHHYLPEVLEEQEIVETPLTESDQRLLSPSGSQVGKDAPRLMYEITSDDGFYILTNSMDAAWKAVTDKVLDARANSRMKQVSYASLSGGSMFGLEHPAVKQVVEQLPGAKYCQQYNFSFYNYDSEDEDSEPEENVSGCARSEGFSERKPHDAFSFLVSKHRQPPPYSATSSSREQEVIHKSQRRATSLDLPIAMRFRHLQEHAKEAVGVYRSSIHGRGLYCKRDIDEGEMIIEYAGEKIRAILCDKREVYYESKGIGCYMFRIDDDEVVDATMNGNAARFINHSCDPNCYSKVITVDNKKHIVIFASRPIRQGEELTYDYKFPIEEVKIPCTCSAKKCRKYLN